MHQHQVPVTAWVLRAKRTGRTVESLTVRISKSTHAALRAIPDERNESMTEILDKAIELYKRKRFLEGLNADFAALRPNKAGWEEELVERKLWDATLPDGSAFARARRTDRRRIENQEPYQVRSDPFDFDGSARSSLGCGVARDDESGRRVLADLDGSVTLSVLDAIQLPILSPQRLDQRAIVGFASRDALDQGRGPIALALAMNLRAEPLEQSSEVAAGEGLV